MNRINISEGLSIFPCKIIKIAIQKNKKDSRPAAESLAIDVFKTAGMYGFPINVLKNYKEAMNNHSILLIE
jgi:hypothetical protein